MKLKMSVLLLVGILVIAAGNTYARKRGRGEEHRHFRTIISQGEINPLPAYANTDIYGYVQMVRYRDGTTSVYVRVEGLAPDTTYNTHVHVLPCSEGGGGHYKINPNVKKADVNNEIWPLVKTNTDGIGRGSDIVPHYIRPEAQSVVIHDTDGTKMACADLVVNNLPVVTRGKFEDWSNTGIKGRAIMTRDNHGVTSVCLEVKGLEHNTTYKAHVHDQSCDEGGGGHYKINYSIPGDDVTNEIWPYVTTNNKGIGRGCDTVYHYARPEAQSVVIHDSEGKIACADLK